MNHLKVVRMRRVLAPSPQLLSSAFEDAHSSVSLSYPIWNLEMLSWALAFPLGLEGEQMEHRLTPLLHWPWACPALILPTAQRGRHSNYLHLTRRKPELQGGGVTRLAQGHMAGYGQSWDLNPGPWAPKHNLSALQDRALGSGRAGGTLSSLALLVVASHCKVAEQEPAERCNRGQRAEVFLNEPTNVGTRKQQADRHQIQRE